MFLTHSSTISQYRITFEKAKKKKNIEFIYSSQFEGMKNRSVCELNEIQNVCCRFIIGYHKHNTNNRIKYMDYIQQPRSKM